MAVFGMFLVFHTFNKKMKKKTTILFYMKDLNEVECELQGAIEKMVPKGQFEMFKTIEELSAKLRMSEHGLPIVVLLASDAGDLKDVLSLKPIFTDIRIILILPDRENDTVTMGHSLHPRFMSYRDTNCHEAAAVLGKMLEA